MSRAVWGICVIGLLCGLAGCGGNTVAGVEEPSYQPRVRQMTVRTASVEQKALTSQLEFTGNLLPRRVTRIVPEIEGIVTYVPQTGAEINVVVGGEHYVERLSMSYGKPVAAGEVLLRMETRDDEISLQIAEAKRDKAVADLAKLKSWERPEQVRRLAAQAAEAKARYEHAEAQYRRWETLHQKNVTTYSELEQASMEMRSAKASYEAAEAVLVQARTGPTSEEIAVQAALIAQAEAEVSQQQRRIEKATLRAPYAGVLTAYQAEVGERVAPGGNPVAEIMDLRYLVAEIAVPEAYIGQIQANDQAVVKAAGANTAVPGLVVALNEMVDAQLRTFQVRVAIDNKAGRFKAGQFATVTLKLGGEERQRLVVPSSAVVLQQGEPTVFVLNADRVQQRAVKLGLTDERHTEILSGVQAGEQVVVDQTARLEDGLQVQVKQ